jgi:uncharacterized OsmC-like protein
MTHQFPLPNVPGSGEAQPPSFISAKVTDGAGRYLLEGEGKAFVADSSHRPGGPVAPNPGELLLSALAVCALGSVQRVAGEENVAVGPRTLATAIAHRNEDEAKRTQFKLVHVEVFVDVADQGVAEKLVGHFTANCPILNTARRGGPVKVDVITATARRTVLDNQADWLDAPARGAR